MKPRISRKKFYQLIKNRGACARGLFRLRNALRYYSVRDVLNLYRSYYDGKIELTQLMVCRKYDYRWLTQNLGIVSVANGRYPGDVFADEVLSKLN